MSQTTDPQAALAKTPKRRAGKPALMTSREAQAAATRAGFICVRAERIEGAAVLGQYATELGPLKLARSWYVMAASEVQDAIVQCNNALAKNPEPDVENALLALKKGFIGDILLSARGMADSVKLDTAPPAPPEPLRQAAFAPNIQVNIGPPQPASLPPALEVETDAE